MRAILLLLSVATMPPPTDHDRALVTTASLRQFESAIVHFRETCGWPPTEEEGLEVLVHKPQWWPADVRWESYLEIDYVPSDGWGNKLRYVLDPELAEGFGIYSCGQDGVSASNGNDDDDLNTWNGRRHWLAYYHDQMRKENRRRSAIKLGLISLAVTIVAVLTWRDIKRTKDQNS
jgi:type II secretion system protein G